MPLPLSRTSNSWRSNYGCEMSGSTSQRSSCGGSQRSINVFERTSCRCLRWPKKGNHFLFLRLDLTMLRILTLTRTTAPSRRPLLHPHLSPLEVDSRANSLLKTSSSIPRLRMLRQLIFPRPKNAPSWNKLLTLQMPPSAPSSHLLTLLL